MSGSKNVIISFKKEASADDKQKVIEDLKGKGAQIVKTDNINSSIMPFVVAAMPEDQFGTLKYETQDGAHDVVKHVEEDGEMRIQPA